jgi:hypothetical protein
MLIFREWEAWVRDKDCDGHGYGYTSYEAMMQARGGSHLWGDNAVHKIRRLHNGSDGGWVASNEWGDYGDHLSV